MCNCDPRAGVRGELGEPGGEAGSSLLASTAWRPGKDLARQLSWAYINRPGGTDAPLASAAVPAPRPRRRRLDRDRRRRSHRRRRQPRARRPPRPARRPGSPTAAPRNSLRTPAPAAAAAWPRARAAETPAAGAPAPGWCVPGFDVVWEVLVVLLTVLVPVCMRHTGTREPVSGGAGTLIAVRGGGRSGSDGLFVIAA